MFSRLFVIHLFVVGSTLLPRISMAQEHKAHSPTHADANAFMHQASFDDLIKRFESPERDAYQKPDHVLNYLGKLKGKTVVDIGSGSGYFSVKLAAKGAKVIASDVNDDFIAYLKNRIQTQGAKNIETRKIPMDNPMIQKNEADLVFVVNTYHHIEERSAYFAKAKKGLKKNGKLVIIDFFKSDVPVGPPTEHKLSIDEVIAELKAAGFEHFDVEVNLLPYQYIVRAY